MDKNQITGSIDTLINDLIEHKNALDILWKYHPSNPKFINPITEYNNLVKVIDNIEKKIIELQGKLSSLN